MGTATVTSKGQVTIPKAVRDALEIQAGDRLAFNVRPDGTVEVHLLTEDIRRLKGMLKAGRPVSLEEMEEAVERGATER